VRLESVRTSWNTIASTREPVAISLWRRDYDEPVLTVENLYGLPGKDGIGRPEPLTLADRIVVHPAAGNVVIINDDRRILHIHSIDVVASMKHLDIQHPTIDSLPITQAKLAQVYEYPIRASSSAGGVKVRLDSGPEGMSVSPEGVLRW